MSLLALYHLVGATTLLLLAALLLLGLSLQLGWRRSAARWPHHLLYFLVTAGTLIAAGLAGLVGKPWWPAALLVLLLLGMSRTRPGRPAHWRLALVVGAGWVGAALYGW
ncbi:hypothetical protein MF271_11545 [Deinococcus sp. KNUC1210]|uniref:hypothetical protein n=1 Tax=Deinococcus sp. KNUC1210 TaxID=2917691 RepID=UPI001EF0AEAC|nr:hypothetical protein [Deinococcus sp. KNUC1210]ULH14641.1 hypothetical protein MF271_11545 [Deinococcus sp. KNUC1210]